MKNICILLVLLFMPILVSAADEKDESDNKWSIVMPVWNSHDVSMGECLIGAFKDTLIEDFINNTGNYKFRVFKVKIEGPDAGAFTLVSGLPVYEVASKSLFASEFRFRPTKVGTHSAEIIIETQADTMKYQIKGVGVQPLIEVLNRRIDFGKVVLGEFKDTVDVVTIKNSGNSLLKITNVKHNLPNDVDFKTISGGGSFDLAIGEEAKLTLRFTPSALGRTNGMLEFHYDGEGSPAEILLMGEGVERKPTISVNNASFADLLCSNSIDYLYPIKNTGNMDLIVESVEKSDVNNDFTVENINNLTIKPDSTYFIKISFNTIKNGLQTTKLIIKSNDKSSPIIQKSISANKYTISHKLSANESDFGELKFNETSSRSFLVLNNGNKANRYDMILPSGFSANPSFIRLDPGRSQNVEITFLGAIVNGTIDEILHVRDSICSIDKDMALKALIKDIQNPKIATISGIIADITCSTSSESFVSIQNIGTADLLISDVVIGGANSSDFSIVGNKSFTITPNSFDTLKYQFTPTSNGLKNATLTFVNNSINEPNLSVNISATKHISDFSYNKTEINFADVELNTQTSEKLLVKNTGDVPTNYSFFLSAGLAFNPNTFALNPGQEIEITVTFLGSATETDFVGYIRLIEQNCNGAREIPVSCKVRNNAIATTTMSISSYSAYAGETIEVPVKIENADELSQFGTTKYSVDLIFNPTLLAPLNFNSVRIDNFNAKISITDIDLDKTSTVKFIVGLGNSESCSLTLSNLTFDMGNVQSTLKPGTFTLLGICREGGTRLVNTSSTAGIIAVSPNPAGDFIEVNYRSSESSHLEISIYNAFGENVKSIINQSGLLGDLTAKVNIKDLSSGYYFVVFNSVTISESVGFSIVR